MLLVQTTEYNQQSSRFWVRFFGFALGFCLVFVGFLFCLIGVLFIALAWGFLLVFLGKKAPNSQQKTEHSFWLFDDTQISSTTPLTMQTFHNTTGVALPLDLGEETAILNLSLIEHSSFVFKKVVSVWKCALC